MRIDQFLWGVSAIVIAWGVGVAFAVFFGLYTGDTDADLHNFGREHLIPCDIVSAVKSELFHFNPLCNMSRIDSHCNSPILQIEVKYETNDGSWRNLHIHYDLDDEAERSCGTIPSCLQHFGLKYGENDCYYGSGSRKHSDDRFDAPISHHIDSAGQEIYFQPNHPHDIRPLIYFMLALIFTMVPCCFFGGVIVAFAAVFDMDVSIFRSWRCDIQSIIEQRAIHMTPYSASISLPSSVNMMRRMCGY